MNLAPSNAVAVAARRARAALSGALEVIRGRRAESFRVVERWRPHSAAERARWRSLGLRIVLVRDHSADELRTIVRRLARGRDPVVIQVYREEQAYRDAKAGNLGTPACAAGFLLSYTHRGSDARLAWMQERGPLAGLFGKTEGRP